MQTSIMAPSSGNRYMICLITFFAVVTVKHTCAKLLYGAPCTQDKQCQHSSLYLFDSGRLLMSGPDTSECKNGRCKCNYAQRRIFTNNNYECKGGGITALIDPHCQRDDPDSCINGVCEKDFFDRLRCTCSNGSTQVEETCREILSVGYGENCKTPASGPVPICDYDNFMHCNSAEICDCYKGTFYDKEKACISTTDYAKKFPEDVLVGLDETCASATTTDLPKVCDKEAHMTCDSKKCTCTKEYFPLESNKTCESKIGYAKKHNLTSYKVMPGEYCSDDSECITGLDCFKKKCACPYPCKFVSKSSSCDCGEVSVYEGASHAILIGVIGGLIIIAFWAHMIKKTLRKGKDKSKTKEEDQNDEPATASHTTTVPLIEPYRIKTQTSEPYGIKTVTSEPYKIKSELPDYMDHSSTPTPSRAPAPSPPPPYALTGPDVPAAPLGFSAPTPSAPPQQQHHTQSAPPYSVSPSMPPISNTPGSSLPYSISPAMPPASDTSPSTIPYPLSPVRPAQAPYSASIPSAHVSDVDPSTANAYPLNPYSGVTPDYVSPTVGAPTYPISDATAPPPYTPTTQTDATAPPAADIYKPIIF